MSRQRSVESEELKARVYQLERENLALQQRLDQFACFGLAADFLGTDDPSLARSLVIARAAIESTAAAILILAIDGGVLMYNRKFESLWNLPAGWGKIPTREARFGHLIAQVDDPHAFVVRLLELEATSDSFGYDIIKLVDGRVLERYSEPYRIGEQITGRIYSYFDVTAREFAQSEIDASRAQLESIFDNAAIGVGLLTSDGTCTLVNRHFSALIGMNPEELLWTPISKFIHEDDRESVELMIGAQVLGECSTARFEVRMHTRDRGEISTDMTLSPIRDAQGLTEGITAIVLDVTERKRAESQRRVFEAKMQQMQKLESLGVLAGGIAHDFNNLLTGILGYADLALYDPHDVETVVESFEQIRVSARRAADLAGQMLAYSGQGRFVLEPINLASMVQDMNQLLLDSISKRCSISYEFDENLPSFTGDASQFRQVIMNLVVNASEALEGRVGLVNLRVGSDYFDRLGPSTVEVFDELPEGTYVFLEVQDNGAGMSEEVRTRVFEPFFSTKFTGRGLGLAAVLGIVRGHKGTISVTSQLGHGSTFRLLVPACPAKAPP